MALEMEMMRLVAAHMRLLKEETKAVLMCQVHQRRDTDAVSAEKVVSCCFAQAMDVKSWFMRTEYLQSQDEVAKAKEKLVSFLSVMSDVNKNKKKKANEG
ncbi:unnamed protein product [Microthlaspi erraticum]|uniref:Uncharacterized protein n=1 Tax=Microthlaspi erraticum TaxID=1685480 RepID=A0A6D2LDV0_9BRAS|nr:unnamed protein product [Microthlaspi erraticum]